jgi:hypothetical protein
MVHEMGGGVAQEDEEPIIQQRLPLLGPRDQPLDSTNRRHVGPPETNVVFLTRSLKQISGKQMFKTLDDSKQKLGHWACEHRSGTCRIL